MSGNQPRKTTLHKPVSNRDNAMAQARAVLPSLPGDGYLNRVEASVFTRLNVQTLDAAIEAGELRCYRVGRRVLLRKQDLVAWLTTKEA